MAESLKINERLVKQASLNYFNCLNLPQNSPVLIITDSLPERPLDPKHSNLVIRRKCASLVEDLAKNNNHPVATLTFDNSITMDDLHKETINELNKLSLGAGGNQATTIVYLGDRWDERYGIYNAADEFGTGKSPGTVRLAGSPGFTTGDCRVLAELNDAKMAKIMEANESYIKFFEEHPQGFFDIVTRTEKSEELHLSLGYDTKQSPFKSSVGKFDQRFVDSREKHTYFNVPSGEIYTIPYPFSEINGEFAAEGLIFRVVNGLLEDVSIPKDYPLEKLDSSQRLLINLIKGKPPKKIPMSELGIGFYQMIGINVYDDASIITREKRGPHAGFGHTAGPGTEKKAIDKLADDAGFKSHADFVMDNSVIMWMEKKDDRQTPFYPPAEKEKLRPKSTAPLHDLFNLVCEILKEAPKNYSNLLNNDPLYLEYFNELIGRVNKEKKSVRRFSKILNLLQTAQFPPNFDAISIRFYREINQQVRHILYLLTYGYFYDTTDDRISIIKIIKNYNEQLLSLSESLGKNSTKEISLAELADAIMEGKFNPLSLSNPVLKTSKLAK